MMTLAGRVMLLLSMLVGGGCATVVAPPPTKNSVPVYLTNYGRHSSILVPAPEGHLNEYAYGDWDWFALNRLSMSSALRAMICSRAPTIGRRQLSIEDDIDAIARATGATTVNRFHVPREKAHRLIAQLDEQYNHRLNTITYNSLSNMWFVRAGRHYSVLHNCNHETAKWLKGLGCRIRGPVMFSAFKLRASR